MNVVSLSMVWREELAALLGDGVVLTAVDPTDRAGVLGALPHANVLLTTRFDQEMRDACTALELIVCPAAGTEGIDRDAVPQGVRVINGAGHESAMAEYVIGAIIALRQRFAAADAALRKGEWRYGFFGAGTMVDEAMSSTVGLIGFGRIGREVARRAAAFQMRTIAVTLHPDMHEDGELLAAPLRALSDPAAVDALVAEADEIVIACELSPLTRNLIDARRFGLMKNSTLLVNVARGPIVDERALFDALASKRIAGAAIDVWYHYPVGRSDRVAPADVPLAELDNILMTPHQSGWTAGSKRRKLEFLAAAINDHAANRL